MKGLRLATYLQQLVATSLKIKGFQLSKRFNYQRDNLFTRIYVSQIKTSPDGEVFYYHSLVMKCIPKYRGN